MEYNAKVEKLDLESTYVVEEINGHSLRKYFYHENLDYVNPKGGKQVVMRSPCRIVKNRKESIGSFSSMDWEGGVYQDMHHGYLVTYVKPGLHQTFKVVHVEGEHGLPSLTLLNHFLTRRVIKNKRGVVQQQFKVTFDRFGKEISFYVFKIRESTT